MKNKPGVPRAMLKPMVGDIAKYIKTNEGCLSILEIIEDIPYDIRADVIEGLSSFHNPAMVDFFQLIQREYGKEFEHTCTRALAKYKLASLKSHFPPLERGDFYRAFASTSRNTGRMTVDVAWSKPDGRLYVECFFLAFSPDGVHSFFVIEDMRVEQYEQDRDDQPELAEVDYSECCALIGDAYKFNVRYMSRPALGRFLYQKYLDDDSRQADGNITSLLRRLSPRLAPRQLVNSFFHALRCQDFNYLFSILDEGELSPGALLQQINRIIKPGALLLEGRVEEIRGSHNKLGLSASSIIMYEREAYRSEYMFSVSRDPQGNWLVGNIVPISVTKLETGSDSDPFAALVYCRVYEILNVDDLFEVLDRVDNIREVEELPYGMHMRVTGFEDDYNHGVTFMSGVIADMVINGDEFVIIAQEQDSLDDLHALLNLESPYPLASRGEYELSLSTAYSYLSGRYIQFEDILLDENEEMAFEDGMRFITARYAVKDRDAVLERLATIAGTRYDLAGGLQVVYQCDHCPHHPGFMAEYIMGPGWITVSAFGDRDISAVRQFFEEGMYDALEFDGLEIREDGIFEILGPEAKKSFPQLEAQLKDMYLNKWYHSHFAVLRGMSPSEACQTEEGTRLLWTMFKHITRKEQQRRLRGDRKKIGVKEYISKINLQQEGEI